MKFSSENPSFLLASYLKNSPTYLNCQVSVKIDKALQTDLETRKFYQDSNDDADDGDDDDGDENHQTFDDEEIRRLYQQQYEHTAKQMNKSNQIPETIPITPTNRKDKAKRAVRSIRDFLLYEWLRDGKSVIMSKVDESQAIDLNGFTLFQNGTLKFQASNLTTGEYRCKAKYVDKMGKFIIGPIISTATVVEIPSEFLLTKAKNFSRTFFFLSYRCISFDKRLER